MFDNEDEKRRNRIQQRRIIRDNQYKIFAPLMQEKIFISGVIDKIFDRHDNGNQFVILAGITVNQSYRGGNIRLKLTSSIINGLNKYLAIGNILSFNGFVIKCQPFVGMKNISNIEVILGDGTGIPIKSYRKSPVKKSPKEKEAEIRERALKWLEYVKKSKNYRLYGRGVAIAYKNILKLSDSEKIKYLDILFRKIEKSGDLNILLPLALHHYPSGHKSEIQHEFWYDAFKEYRKRVVTAELFTELKRDGVKFDKKDLKEITDYYKRIFIQESPKKKRGGRRRK